MWIPWVLWSLLVGSGLFCGWHLFTVSELSRSFYVRRIQQSVARIDAEMLAFQEALAFRSDGSQLLLDPDQRYSFFEHQNAMVFQDDSLLFWNNNLIEPRVLFKRLSVPVDTIVHFNVGDYLVKSFRIESCSVFLFTLLSTDYPVKNAVFVNRFQPLPIQREVRFMASEEPGSHPVAGSSGTPLSYFVLSTSAVRGLDSSLPVACLLVMLCCTYLLCCRSLVARTPRYSPTARITRSKWLWPLLATFALMVLTFFLFRGLCRYLFAHGFFIPGSMQLDRCFLLLFLFLLSLLTAVLLLKRLFQHYHPNAPRNELYSMVLLLMLLGVLLTWLYNREYTRFENQKVRSLAVDLADERDPQFEASYRHFLDVAPHDTTFFTTLLSEDVMEAVAEDYMRSFLFDSVMNQYNVSATLCSPGMELVVQPFDEVTDCDAYFLAKVNGHHGINLDDGLYFLDYNTLDPSYLSTFDFMVGDSLQNRTVYLEFSKPIAPQGFGMPKMLQNDNSLLPLDYSVACYKDSLLVYKYGPYLYPNYLSDFRHLPNGFYYGRRHKHFTLPAEEGKEVVVSLPRRDWKQVTTPFVVFFLILMALFLLVYFVGGVRRHYPLSNTLSNQFQMLVLIALGLSFLVVGPVSVFYMRSFYTQKSDDFHFERIRTLLLDITGEVDFSFLKRPGFKYELDAILRRYSETFFTDINLYGLDGKMLATTSPELLDLHLQSSLMDAEAYHNLQGEKSLYYIHDEHLGKAVFQSAYLPIQDGNGNNLAYLNTPYFTSRSELRSEILNFLLTYINIILVFVTGILAFLLYKTRRLTDPLVRLQEKMRQIDLNKSNEMLEWKSKDEIGALVNQYNQLVVELEKSAAELRRTTTESAWRGVARQVAHEIKNSLTPMRLSVQLLERSLDNGADDMDQRVRRTTHTLLEQIDALSDMASSFSNYAKLPENHPQPFDLAELVGNLVNLYDNEGNITFRFDYDPQCDYTFNGDKTNLNSAVGNLIKNAVQAIGTAPEGHIAVRLTDEGDGFVIAVKDNGKGIKDEDKNMIFLPNFTTKSSGSGVGLSLTYNIVKAAGGTIVFDSRAGEGAEFVISLPK